MTLTIFMLLKAFDSAKCGTVKKIHVRVSATCVKLNPSNLMLNTTVYIATPRKMKIIDIFVKPEAGALKKKAAM